MPRMPAVVLALLVAAGCASALPASAQPLAASGAPIVLAPRVQLTEAERARLQAIANQGADALRRFLWRTRMIYNWTWRDLVASE